MSKVTIYEGYIPMDFTVMDSGMPRKAEPEIGYVAVEYAVEQERRIEVLRAAVRFWQDEARWFKGLFYATLIGAACIIAMLSIALGLA